MRKTFASAPMKPVLLALLILLPACAKPVSFGTETAGAICAELRSDLPTYSRRDTPETLEAGARYVATFAAVCGLGR